MAGDAGLEEIQEARRPKGELGREEMRDMREDISEVGGEMVAMEEGGGTGIGERVTLVTGSTGSEVIILQYLSLSRGDIDW